MTMSSDTVMVHKLRLPARIGFHEFERHMEQVLTVDLWLTCDFGLGPALDRHEGLVDYYVLTQHLLQHVKGRAYDLIEAMAVDLAHQIVTLHPQVTARVRISKLPLDMPWVEGVAVEVVRQRSDFEEAKG